MIKTFADKNTETVFAERVPKGFPADLFKPAFRKLLLINRAESVGDLRSPPGNHLEELSGNRQGQHSVRINKQWRDCFEWRQDGAYNVEICDYH